MPTITENPIRGHAHCRNARCMGYEQAEVDAVQVEHAFTGRDLGDDSNSPYSQIIERSTVNYKFANEDEASCPACGEVREVTGSARPVYANVSGYDPNYLRDVARKFDPQVVNTAEDHKYAELEAKNVALEAKLDQLLDAVGEK